MRKEENLLFENFKSQATMRYLIITIGIILITILLLSTLYNLGILNPSSTSIPSTSIAPVVWLSSWSYRRNITIDNRENGNTLSNYQVLVHLNTKSLISERKMRRDCGDIRFTDSDGKTLLSYWIENGCNSTDTQIWVKIPSIPAWSTKTVYVYYGNFKAGSESNGKNTFYFFDDFSEYPVGSSLAGEGGWINAGSKPPIINSSGGSKIATFTYGGVYQNLTISNNTGYAIRCKVHRGTSGDSSFMLFLNRYGFFYFCKWDPSNDIGVRIYRIPDGKLILIGSNSFTAYLSCDDWDVIEGRWFGSNLQFYRDGNKMLDINYSPPDTHVVSGIAIGANATWSVDYILVRLFNPPEPLISIGAEKGI